MTAELARLGMTASCDRTALELYCQAYADWRSAIAKLKSAVIYKGPKGLPVVSPYFAIAQKAQAAMLRLLVEFGMTPSSRTRIHAPAQPANQLQEFLDETKTA